MRDLLTKDLGWKLFSLFLALAIWLTVHKINEESEVLPGTGPTVTIEGLPVLVVSSAADVHDFRVAPRVVTVTVSGSSEAISKLQYGQIHAIVDLTEVTNLTSAKELDRQRPVDISAPTGISLIAVNPPTVGIILPPKH